MISNKLVFNTLILFSMISFGVVGSLSHFFNLVIIGLIGVNLLTNKDSLYVNSNSKKLFFFLSSLFFIFLIRGLFYDDTLRSFEALSPMLPIPVIGLMILITNDRGLYISAKNLQLFAKLAVCTTFFLYLLLSDGLAIRYGLTIHFLGRLEMFSGNPIPFSTALFGITVFCFSNWQNSTKKEKAAAILCCAVGFWLAGVASGTRGALTAIIISLPFLIWFTVRSLYITISILIISGAILLLLHLAGIKFLHNHYMDSLGKGFETLFQNEKTDSSMGLKLEMWSAAIESIKANFFFGYDISNRWGAIRTNLAETFSMNYTHPHNDILASAISVGFVGAILSILSLLSPIWASLLSTENIKQKLFLAVLVNLNILITANVNTIFFNDITSAWLAFSTFLIWRLHFTDNKSLYKNT